MKIKHFSGYGYVNARKIVKDTKDGMITLVVEVVGNHERGIVRSDDYSLIKKWLVDRFDKAAEKMPSWKIDYTVLLDIFMSEVDRAVYTIVYPDREWL